MKCSTSHSWASSPTTTTRTSKGSYIFMAQLTSQGGALKLLFRVSSGKVGGRLRLMEDTHKKNSMIRMMSSLGRNSGSSSADCGEEFDDDVEFERDELSCYRGLVLDISYRPVNVVCWKRAICLEYMDKADVLEYYDQTVNSANGSFYIPAVLRVPNLLQVVQRRRIKQNLSRKNIFFRDAFKCQYCSSHENLTVDHVLPISRGGKWEWNNLVAACAKCNSRKGHKTLEEANMKLLKVPKAPKDFDILAIPLTTAALKSLRRRKGVPNEWHQYLGKLPSETGQ